MNDNSIAQSKTLYSKFDEPNLKILEEQLNYESIMNKKYNQYAVLCEDAQLKNICHNAAKAHKHNYKILLSYLNSQQ